MKLKVMLAFCAIPFEGGEAAAGCRRFRELGRGGFSADCPRATFRANHDHRDSAKK